MMRYAREMAIALANALLLTLLACTTHGFFSAENLRDLFLANMPVMLIALGMTAIIATGEIDISVGSVYAVCGAVAGVAARHGAPGVVFLGAAVAAGALCGALNGALTAWLGVPSIVVTLASMVALRDGLRWATEGAWISALPASFVRFGMGRDGFFALMLAITIAAVLLAAAGLRNLRVGRMVLAVGSNRAAALQLGIPVRLVTFAVFLLTGCLTGLAATLNAVRFQQVPSNSGLGLELKVIAAVAVGGAAITGGSAAVPGTVLGVMLLSIVGPALTFLGVSAYWEQAVQGLIILAAVSADAVRVRYRRRARGRQ